MEEVNYRFEEKNKTQYQRLSKFIAFGIGWFWKMIIEIIGEGYKWFIENSYRQLSQKNAVSTPNQITAAEEYQDHENCPFEEENIARIANAVQVTICLLVCTSVY